MMNLFILVKLLKNHKGRKFVLQIVCSFLTYSFEYQSVVSALVPTLVIMRHANLSLGVTDTLKALLEILSSDQLEMEQPQVLQ